MKLLGIVSFPFRRKSGTTSLAHLQSTVRSNPTTVPVRDFRPTSIAVKKNIDQMIRAAQSFTEPVLRQDAGELIEEIHSCTFDPGMHLVRCSQTFYSIPLYVEDGISMNKKRFEAAHQLAQIIRGLVTKVFHMPLRTAYLFRDKKSGKRTDVKNSSRVFFFSFYSTHRLQFERSDLFQSSLLRTSLRARTAKNQRIIFNSEQSC